MNAACPTECGQVWRKIESECHDALRNRGYSFGRNFGCGNRHTAAVNCLATPRISVKVSVYGGSGMS